MSLSAQLFGRNSFIHRATNILGLGIPTWLDKKFGPKDTSTSPTIPTVQDSAYGNPIPRFYGTVATAGNIIWLKGGKLDVVVKKAKRGGKGGSSSTAQDTYLYYGTFALALGQGPITGIRRMWCGDKLIYNAGSDDIETIVAGNKNAKGWKLYRGTDDQLPDPDIQADKGAANTPAYRGLVYIKFKKFALKNFGDSLAGAQFKVEVITTSFSTPNPVGSYSFLGTPVGYGEGVVYTTEITAEYVTAGFYHGDITYRTYSVTDGRLLKEEFATSSIEVQGSPSLSFYKTYPIVNRPGTYAVQRKSGTPILVFSTGPSYSPPGAFAFVYEIYHGGEEFWVASSDGLVKVPDVGGATAFPLGNRFAWIPVRIDERTGRRFLRYQRFTDAALFFCEFDTDPNSPLWQYQVGLSIAESTSDQQSFAVEDNRVLMGVAGSIKTFAVNTASLTLLGQLSYGTGGRSVYDIGPMIGIADGGQAYQYSDRTNQDLVPLADIIQMEVERSNLISSADIDVSLLNDGVHGYRIAGGSQRDIIEQLRGAYPFDVRMHGFKLQCVPRGQAPVASVPWEDLAATNDEEIPDSLPYEREMDSQLPAKVTVKGISAVREYADSSQPYERTGTDSVNSETFDSGLVLSDDELAQMAEMICESRWMERESYSFSLSPTYQYLEPADIVTVNSKFAVIDIRLTEATTESDGRMTLNGFKNSAALYVRTAVGAPAPGPDGTIGLAGETAMFLADAPMIYETEQNLPGISTAATGYSEGWPGGVLVRSTDSGQTWNDIQGYIGKATAGFAMNVLSANSGALLDVGSALRVSLLSGELEGVTFDQMMSGSNIALYGADQRWEVIRFQNAALQSDGTYLLSGLVRGDKGTEWATGLHQAGDAFILATDPDNVFIPMAIETIGRPMLYRGVTNGGNIEDASDISLTYQGVNLKPLSPVAAGGTRNGSGDLAVSFTRRSRFTSNWWVTGVPAPVGETSEFYQADVMSGSTVKRTISATTPSFTYSAADQTTDFGSPQASITLRIYQMSSTVGRGYPREVTL